MEYIRYKTLHFSFLPICLCFSNGSRTSFTRLTHLFPHLIFFLFHHWTSSRPVYNWKFTNSTLSNNQSTTISDVYAHDDVRHVIINKLFKPRYSWNIAKVGVKHQSINDHHQFIYSNLCFFRKLNTCCIL